MIWRRIADTGAFRGAIQCLLVLTIPLFRWRGVPAPFTVRPCQFWQLATPTFANADNQILECDSEKNNDPSRSIQDRQVEWLTFSISDTRYPNLCGSLTILPSDRPRLQYHVSNAKGGIPLSPHSMTLSAESHLCVIEESRQQIVGILHGSADDIAMVESFLLKHGLIGDGKVK